jgi:hypothetical protein
MDPGPPRVWHFEYITKLNTDDHEVVKRDIMAVWGALRPEAERLKVDHMWISAWDERWRLNGRHAPVYFRGESVDTYMRRQPDGSWQ